MTHLTHPLGTVDFRSRFFFFFDTNEGSANAERVCLVQRSPRATRVSKATIFCRVCAVPGLFSFGEGRLCMIFFLFGWAVDVRVLCCTVSGGCGGQLICLVGAAVRVFHVPPICFQHN